jgi:hypothetical protein
VSLANIVKIDIECEFGVANRFRFKGTLPNATEVTALGMGGQNVELFKDLLKKLAEVYPLVDSMPVEVQHNRIIGVP